MWETLLWSVVGIFAVIGAVEMARAAVDRWGKKQLRCVLMVPMKGRVETAEAVLGEALAAAEEMRAADVSVAVVDCGMEQETRRACELFCGEDNCARLFSRDEFCDIIQKNV